MLTKLGKILGIIATLALLGWAFSASAVVLEEGKNFKRLQNPQPTETGGKIEVIEFFSYQCPHCAHFEPVIEPWIKKLPSDVQFHRVPALFQPGWTELAKAYYTLDAMGVAEKLSATVFKAIHEENVQLRNDKTFFDWAAKQGLDRQKVTDIYNSFAVNSRVNRAKSQAQAYRLDGVPSMAIDGKYFITGEMAGSYPTWLEIADALIAKARQERGGQKK